IITAGILVSSVALIRIAMESLAAFGVIFIPSWLAGMCDRYVWSIPACLVLIFTWAFNLFLLFGSILHLQNRPSASKFLRTYALGIIPLHLFWLIPLWASLTRVVPADSAEFIYIFISTFLNGLLYCAYPVLLLMVLRQPI